MKQKKQVLVVDDEPALRSLFRRELQDEGFNVIEAADGQSGLDLIRRKRRAIDLLILDICLPELNGIEVYETVKKEFDDMKVIISSVYDKDEQEFFVFGADDYYYKSENITTLIGKVKNLIGQ